ncbi:MAG: hypothetical protein MJZ16_02135 [Bacteroidales bacterium]|nr:hypothetical protein [Bacteroidales bacterium]
MNRLSILSIFAAAILCVGCFPTRIVTVSPGPTIGHSTTVTYPTAGTTTHVYSPDYDICLHLDLQAVGAAFAQAYTVREFETILNNSSYMISNLDLNHDGYIDYLRVIETVDRHAHIFVIQAVLGRNIYQDVATLVVENPSLAGCYVEIIGAPFIYGPKYIVRPIYKTRPNIFPHLCTRYYTPWSSPWHWDSFPSYYKRPVPMYLSHYQAYINTYMHNHMYCKEILYPTSYHYVNYSVVTKSIQRNDYSAQHPNESFEVRTRTADPAGPNSAVLRAQNARDIREAQERSANRAGTTATTGVSRTGTTSTTTATPSRSGSTTTATAPSRTGTTSTGTAPARTGSTAATTTTAPTRTGSTAGTTTTTTSRSGNTATSASGTTTSRSGSAATSSSTSRSSAGQTTVNSRVSNSGATRTTTRTTTSSGTTTTRSSSTSSSATRSSSSTGSSSSASSSSSAPTRSSSSTTSTSSSSSSTRSGSSSSTATRSGSTTTSGTRGR